MKLSKLGRRCTQGSGIWGLMDDLGTALAGQRRVLMLGGGNPSHIPEVEAVWRARMLRIAEDPGRFGHVIGDYSPPQGDAAFIESLAELLRLEYGWRLGPGNIALTSGSQLAFFLLFNMLAGEHADGSFKKVLLPMCPEYIGYADLGVAPDLCTARRPTIEGHGPHRFKYRLTLEDLAIGEDIAAICVSRPTNPTGNVLTDGEIVALAEAARANQVLLIVDSAYGAPFPNIVFVDAKPIWDETIILCMSLSKLGLPGARTGIVIAGEEVITHLVAMNAVVGLAPGNFGPALVTDAVRSGAVLRMSREVIQPYYARRAQDAAACLDEHFQGLPYRLHRIEGALFLWLWLPDLPISSLALYTRLKERGVVVVSGHYFFPGFNEEWPHTRECLRINYAQAPEVVHRGIAIIAEEVRKIYG